MEPRCVPYSAGMKMPFTFEGSLAGANESFLDETPPRAEPVAPDAGPPDDDHLYDDAPCTD
jgi:hypothetical protein